MLKYLLPLFITLSTSAQDERFFRDMLRGGPEKREAQKARTHFINKSGIYHIDLTGDMRKEYIRFETRDGVFHVNMYSHKRELIKTYEFEPLGERSRVYRVLRKNIAPGKVLTLFFFYDGSSGYMSKVGTASVYGMVVENNDLKAASIKKLVSTWLEKEERDLYIRRLYKISFKDLNGDDQLEMILTSGRIRRNLFYKGDNRWIEK